MQSFVLPEWWEDELADIEANRSLAEAYLARQLGFTNKELRDRDRPLSWPKMAQVRFKRYKNTIDDKVRASTLVAQRAAGGVVRAIEGRVKPFAVPQSAQDLRDQVLINSRFVDLDSLVSLCWEMGIPVLYLAHTPKGSKRFDGMAAFIGHRPVIVLASGRDGAPWLAFHLAHELGHIMLGHVAPGKAPVVDGQLTAATDSGGHEREADRFACELLTGDASPRIRNLNASAAKLAVIAERKGPSEGVDPGVFALIYARSNNRWPVAQNALKYLERDTGGQAMVASILRKHLPEANLSESDERFLNVLKIA